MSDAKLGADGLPVMTAEERDKGEATGRKMVAVLMAVPSAIGLGIAAAIYKFGDTAAYDARIDGVVKEKLHWGFLAALVFSKTVTFSNLYPMIYKSRVMLGSSGNLRANMYIFRATDDKKQGAVVTLDSDGDAGKYNRANRSLHHLVENMAAMCVGLLPAAYCFPFPTFITSLLFGSGRVLHQIGYTNKGYGGHAPGFGLALLANVTLEGLLAIVGLKGLGLF